MSAFRTFVTAASLAVLPTLSLAAPPYQTVPATPATSKPAPQPSIPAPKALPPEIAGECAWTGKRVISLLARDDVAQAERFLSFYRDFGCREAHIGPTFRCVIMGDGGAATDGPAGEESFTARVDRCWARD